MIDPRIVRRELAAVGLILLSVFLAGSLVFQRVPESGRLLDATGSFGPVGTYARAILVGTVGIPGTALVALGLFIMALTLFGQLRNKEDDVREWGILFAGIVALVPVAVGLARGAPPEASSLTGLWGSFVAHYLQKGFGSAGAWIFFLLATCALTVATLRWNPIRMFLWQRSGKGANPRGWLFERVLGHSRRAIANDRLTLAETLEPAPEDLPAIDRSLLGESTADFENLRVGPDPGKPDEGRFRRRGGGDRSAQRKVRDTESAAPGGAENAGTNSAAGSPSSVVADEHHIDYGDKRPPTEILSPATARHADVGRRELDAAGEKLMNTLRTFKVDGALVGRTTGPTVTQFEIEPAAGVKVRQIAALADDLALAMRAASIRIVAPIPGRGAVGVEVPNPTPGMVMLREVLESSQYQNARAALPIALGKDLEGQPVIADLARMPHLLIAGATGSGKSVCVNTIITSLVYRHTPKTLRFLMVDPKMVELSVYNTLPHLRHRVITDNRDAASVLKWAVHEMQERYRLLEANACRNVQEFNKRVKQRLDGDGAALQKPRNPEVAFEDRTYTAGILPYIVVVIDEMADLMMTVQGEVETPIAMLAQKARAIGIHLILATQRPSVNVITGLIKANFPCRIAFRVASQVDSRTIIDGAGAEALLGNGDMLFIPPGKSEPARLQGAYLSSEDTEKLLTWYSTHALGNSPDADNEHRGGTDEASEPDILEAVRAMEAKSNSADDEDADGGAADERDKRFREAAEVVIQHKQGSTSLLQRRLRIGYGRAARIIDQLEEAGVLSPSEGGSRPREVLVGTMDLDRICGGD